MMDDSSGRYNLAVFRNPFLITTRKETTLVLEGRGTPIALSATPMEKHLRYNNLPLHWG
jgi:hypothetical protein